MCAGDWEEHAILLCNYMLTLGYAAYVVLGNGAQDADVAYVLTLPTALPGSGGPNGEPMLWNPVSGQQYVAKDTSCDLISVDCVFNAENVWGNNQAHAEPWSILWDLSNTQHWKPIFNAQFPPRALPTLQVAVEYEAFARDVYVDIEQRVDKEVMTAIEDARTFGKRQTTRWNRVASRELKRLLQDMEERVVGIAPPDVTGRQRQQRGEEQSRFVPMEEQHAAALDPVSRTHRILGFPIHLNYTDVESIHKAVLSSGITHEAGEDAEFAHAVVLNPYGVSFVCSVWVYVAVLYKKGRRPRAHDSAAAA